MFFWVAGNARVGSLSPHRAYKKQEVIGRFSVGRVGPVGRVGRYHAGRICARPTGPTRPTRPTTHKQNLSGLRAAPALESCMRAQRCAFDCQPARH